MAIGKKTGGRKKGSLNKATVLMKSQMAVTGETPLEFMLGVMRDVERSFDTRLDAAKSAAPYVHPKLAAIEHSGKGGGPMQFENMTDDELFTDIQRLREEISRTQGQGTRTTPSPNGSTSTLHGHNGSV